MKKADGSTTEDYLRAASYAAIALWAVTFLIWPPTPYLVGVDFLTRAFWMGVTAAGASMALVGALRGIDLKLELPGIVFLLIGPTFFFITQLYFVLTEPNFDLADDRFHILVFSLIPVLLLQPRAYTLYKDSRRLKRINTTHADPKE